MLHDGHGRGGGQALQQAFADLVQMAHAHVNDQRQFGLPGGMGQLRPVGAAVAGLGVACDEHHAMRVFAVRQGCAQAAHARQARRDAVDHLNIDARCPQVLDLFAAATKDERVAPLQAHHLLARLHRLNHQLVDEGLGCAAAAATFAHMHDAG